MKTIILVVALFSLNIQANMEELATYIDEARVLVETREYLKTVKDDLATGGRLDRQTLSSFENKLERIAIRGCDCENNEKIIRAQAYAMIGTINGVISKETRSISHGKKSYQDLEKARELDPRNVDAIRGQGEALKAILSQGFFSRNIVSMTLGLDLRKEQRKLIRDLKTFTEHKHLLRLAEQLARL
ncbi:MAG: hypothetical protein VXV96_06630 [Bdellovibrionota bacterium]|nr:hypothetical protein [Bdellovibrionota bacterium]